MNNEKKCSDLFLNLLKIREPNKSRLAEKISDLLIFDKSSAYRRLRGEIPFTFNEICILCKYFEISLDEIVFTDNGADEGHIFLTLALFKDPKKITNVIEIFLRKAAHIQSQPDSRLYMAVNTLQIMFYGNCEHLLKYFIFKWGYRNATPSEDITYDDAKKFGQMSEALKKLANILRNFQSVTCIWDPSIILNTVNDIKYLESIRLITRDDVLHLKNDLFRVINNLEQDVIISRMKDTGNKFNLYLSSLDLENSLNAMGSQYEWAAILWTFSLHSTVAFNQRAYVKAKDWIEHMKRFSILLSGTGDKERVAFFDEQRRLIEAL